MTSLAFGAVLFPLLLPQVLAVSRHEIGMSVFGSVVIGTVLVPVFTVFFFVLVHSLPTLQWSLRRVLFRRVSKYRKDHSSL